MSLPRSRPNPDSMLRAARSLGLKAPLETALILDKIGLSAHVFDFDLLLSADHATEIEFFERGAFA